MLSFCKRFFLLLSLGSSTLQAMPGEGGGYPFDIPRARPQRIDHIPATHLPLTHMDAESQWFVDYGIELIHGFWTAEAETMMREVIARNPQHPLPEMLAAYFQTIFDSGDFARGRDYFKRAQTKYSAASSWLSEYEKAWFQALRKVYSNSPSASDDHIKALRTIVQQYPEDLEAKSFLALALWYSKYNQKNEIDRLVNAVIQIKPNHPAHHYKIHLWDSSLDAHRALASARASGPAQPQTAHLWHMPAHIFTHTKDIFYSWLQSEKAHQVDHEQMAQRTLMPTNQHNYVHNLRDYMIPGKAAFGQARDAVARSAAFLRTGQQPNNPALSMTLRLARVTVNTIIQYQMWDVWTQLDQETLLPGLIKDPVSDLKAAQDELQGYFLYLRVRSALAQDSLGLAQEQFKALEMFAAAHPDRLVVGQLRSDAQYFLNIDAPTRLASISPAGQVLETECSRHHWDNCKSQFNSLLTTNNIYDIASLIFVKKTYNDTVAGLGGDLSALQDKFAALWKPAFGADDFQEFALAKTFPSLVQQLAGRAAKNLAQDIDSLPSEYRYLKPVYQSIVASNYRDPATFTLPEVPSAESVIAAPAAGGLRAFVFSQGYSCIYCRQQMEALEKNRARLESQNIDVRYIVASGQNQSDPYTVVDPELEIFKSLGVWDEFLQFPLHGIFVINHERKIVWHSVTEHAEQNINALVNEWTRLRDLEKLHY